MLRCPLCGSEAAECRIAFATHSLIECSVCSTSCTYPQSPPADRSRHYREDYHGVEGARFRPFLGNKLRALLHRRRARLLVRRLGGATGRRFLDVGCGGGEMLRNVQRLGGEAWGVDVSRSAVTAARRSVGHNRIATGGLHEAGYPAASFDCITMWHVLEHSSEPLSELRRAAALLKPGGFLYVEVPNAGSWSARHFGSNWLAYDIPNHQTHFTPRSLQTAADLAGLRCLDWVHWSPEYCPVTLLQSFLNSCLGGDSILFRNMVHEGSAAHKDRSRRRLVLHYSAAIAFAMPALAFSCALGMRHESDTVGVYMGLG